MAWGQGNKNKKQKANTSWAKEQIAEYLVLNPVPINAEPWSPLTACQFPGIADFVATLRHECCQHGAHFMWPSASIGFQISLTYALHMLGPGHSVSIRNAATPSPHILANYPVDYYHGTSCSALVRGVLRHGLQPSSGAGSEDLRKAFGVPVPLVYTSRRRECAMGYRALQIDSPKTRQILLAFFVFNTFLLATIYSLFTAYREKGVLHFLAIYECPEVSRVLHGLNQ